MARLIEWDGQPFALLIETDEGNYLVPPIVLDEGVVKGQEVLAAIVEAGVPVTVPVIENASPAMQAEVDQRLALLSERLGVPVFDE